LIEQATFSGILRGTISALLACPRESESIDVGINDSERQTDRALATISQKKINYELALV
jgi:hypothetical protein